MTTETTWEKHWSTREIHWSTREIHWSEANYTICELLSLVYLTCTVNGIC